MWAVTPRRLSPTLQRDRDTQETESDIAPRRGRWVCLCGVAEKNESDSTSREGDTEDTDSDSVVYVAALNGLNLSVWFGRRHQKD